jgi:hypothetical protein
VGRALVRICSGIKRDGARCTQSVFGTADFCHHDPRRAGERKRQASKAGKSRTPRIISDLHDLLDNTTERVLSGDLKPYPGMVAGQLIGVKIRLLEFEKALREQEELEECLERLEELANQQQQRRPQWVR